MYIRKHTFYYSTYSFTMIVIFFYLCIFSPALPYINMYVTSNIMMYLCIMFSPPINHTAGVLADESFYMARSLSRVIKQKVTAERLLSINDNSIKLSLIHLTNILGLVKWSRWKAVSPNQCSLSVFISGHLVTVSPVGCVVDKQKLSDVADLAALHKILTALQNVPDNVLVYLFCRRPTQQETYNYYFNYLLSTIKIT